MLHRCLWFLHPPEQTRVAGWLGHLWNGDMVWDHELLQFLHIFILMLSCVCHVDCGCAICVLFGCASRQQACWPTASSLSTPSLPHPFSHFMCTMSCHYEDSLSEVVRSPSSQRLLLLLHKQTHQSTATNTTTTATSVEEDNNNNNSICAMVNSGV